MTAVVDVDDQDDKFGLFDDVNNSVWPDTNGVLTLPVARKSLARKRISTNITKSLPDPCPVIFRKSIEIFSCLWFYF